MDNIEHIFLIVQNDGNGDQCGYSYRQRRNLAARDSQMMLSNWVSMAARANSWLKERGYNVATDSQVMKAAEKLMTYYKKHIKE